MKQLNQVCAFLLEKEKTVGKQIDTFKEFFISFKLFNAKKTPFLRAFFVDLNST